MNKTVMYLGIVGVAAIGLIGTLVLTALDKDSTAFNSMFMTLLPIVITAGVTFHGLSKVQASQERIAKAVNGNTTKLIEAVRAAPSELVHPNELARIEAESAKLIDGGKHSA